MACSQSLNGTDFNDDCDSQARVFVPSEAILSTEGRQLAEYIVEGFLTTCFCLLGIVGNIINIIVFYKLGYKETINISMTTIAFWDLISSMCGLVHKTRTLVQLFLSPADALTYEAFTTLIPGFLTLYCVIVSSVLASYVAVERCLCISMPFTVKYLLTPKVVTTVNVSLSVIFFFGTAVLYVIDTYEWVYYPEFNTTVAQMSYRENMDVDAFLDYNSGSSFAPICISLFVQISCFFIISYHLRKASGFRAQSTIANNATEKSEGDPKKPKSLMSARDRQVIRMLQVIIFIYITGLLPNMALDVAKLVESRFYLMAEFHNFFMVFYYCVSLLFHVSASVNCLVYYFMSSHYKAKFQEIFHISKK